MTLNELQDRIVSTYDWLRLGMGHLAWTFPFVLVLWGKFIGDVPPQGSLSAYYYACRGGIYTDSGSMRNWFVGILFAIGIMLILYRGFSKAEDRALNCAGISAVGIAMFPMQMPGSTIKPFLPLHGVFAVSFFLCLAYVCIFHATDTLKLLSAGSAAETEAAAQYRWQYKLCGTSMVVSPLFVVIYSVLYHWDYVTLGVEAVGVWTFSAYWLLKSAELRKSTADLLAATGKLEVKPDYEKPTTIGPRRSRRIVAPPSPTAADELFGLISVEAKADGVDSES